MACIYAVAAKNMEKKSFNSYTLTWRIKKEYWSLSSRTPIIFTFKLIICVANLFLNNIYFPGKTSHFPFFLSPKVDIAAIPMKLPLDKFKTDKQKEPEIFNS